MKILFLTNTCWNIYNFRLELIKSLQDLNYEIFVAAPKDKYTYALLDNNIKLYDVNMNANKTNIIDDISLIIQYRNIYKSIRPDIVLSYTIKCNIYGNIAFKGFKTPIINNVSGLGTIYINNNILTFIVNCLYKFSFFNSSWVFFQNNDDLKLFLYNKIVAKSIVSVIPGSGVNIDKFKYFRNYNSAKKFVFVGRILRDKGIYEYIESANNILNIYPETFFYIIGDIINENKNSLSKDELQNLINHKNIIYLDVKENMSEVLKQFDVMVLPSYREGLSKALLEAASMSMPIITNDVPGCKEIVKDGYNGFLSIPKSSQSLTLCIEKIIKLDSKSRVIFGENSRKIAKKYFCSNIINKIYIDKILSFIK